MFRKIILSAGESANVFKVTLSGTVALFGGCLAKFFGGIDTLLITLVTMIVIDYITGVIRAIYRKKLSSSIGFKGILKKALCLMIVGLSVALQNVMPEGLPLREITILFFIANEGISVLENAAGVIPLPKKLLNVLVQIREENGEETALEIKDEEDMTSQE